MFITRKRLEEIKCQERWEYESRLNREREMSDMRARLNELEYKVAMLENKFNIPSTPNVTPTWGTINEATCKGE